MFQGQFHMAGYRQFHTKFWKDGWVIELDPLERYLFSYLFTNEQSSISGIFELPLKIIINETGLDPRFIQSTLMDFQKAEKIFYQDGIMWVVNMEKHHKNMSPKTQTRVNADVAAIPDCPVKTAYLYYQKTGKYNIDTTSIPYPYPALKAKDESKDKAKDESEDKEGGALPDPDPFEAMRINIEKVTGLPPDHGASQAIDELINMKAIYADIEEGYKWFTGQKNNVFRYYSQLVGPTRTAMAKRIQGNNGWKSSEADPMAEARKALGL